MRWGTAASATPAHRSGPTPELRAQLTKLGTVPGNLTIPQFTEFVKKELEDTRKILDAAGIKPQ